MHSKISPRSLIFKVILGVGDFSILFLSIVLAFWIKFGSGIIGDGISSSEFPISYSIILSIIGVILLFYEDFFEIKKPLERSELLLKVIKVSFTLSVIGAIIALVSKETIFSQIVFDFSFFVTILSFLFTIIFLFTIHLLSYEVIKHYRQKGIGFRKAVIIGTGKIEIDFWNALKENIYSGYDILGFVTTGKKKISRKIRTNILGKVEDLKKILIDYDIDEVVLSNPTISQRQILTIMGICDKLDVKINIIPNIYGVLTYKTKISTLLNFPLISFEEKLQLRWNKFLKMCVDIIFATVMLIIAFPLFVIIAIFIKFETEGPIFFIQKRLGKGERSFALYKFRSMVQDAEKQFQKVEHLNQAKGALFKIKNDPRLTLVGKFLRKYSLDELPQLFNVINGDMSLVGPRPSLDREAKKYEEWQLKRYDIKPGVTGLAQVSGRSDLSFDKILELDLYYMKNWSIGLDFKILLKTIRVVLRAKGAY